MREMCLHIWAVKGYVGIRVESLGLQERVCSACQDFEATPAHHSSMVSSEFCAKSMLLSLQKYFSQKLPQTLTWSPPQLGPGE